MRRLTLLLLALLLVVALWGRQSNAWWPLPGGRTVVQTNQPLLPEVVPPSGALELVFEQARPATLRIEARLPGHPVALGIGTGFFFSRDGLVLTAFHVVDRSQIEDDWRSRITYVGVGPDGREYPLELVGFDAYLDLAVLRASVPGEVPYLPLTKVNPSVDSEVLAIGNSRGDFLQGRVGRVTRLGVKSPRARFAEGTIELTAALSPGDSGGPVLNAKGEAVGVVSFISFNPEAVDPPPYLRGVLRPSFASYAVPVLAESEVLSSLVGGARHDIPVIGLSFSQLGADYHPRRSPVDLGRRPGAIVSRVAPGGPADAAGLRDAVVRGGELVAADVIVAVDDVPTPTADALIEELYHKAVGQVVTVTVQRGAQTFKVRVKLGAKSEVFG